MASPSSRAAAPDIDRRLPVGAEPRGEGVHFRVWAPDRGSVDVRLEDGRTLPLGAEGDGYFSARLPVGAGTRYRYRLDGDEHVTDPASRFQPEGPFGPSEVIDPAGFAWSDAEWTGVAPRGQVLYEVHVGTFTPEGSWRAATERLPDLAALGVTVLEVMPVADFAGAFG